LIEGLSYAKGYHGTSKENFMYYLKEVGFRYNNRKI